MRLDNGKARAYLENLNDMPIGERSEYALSIPNLNDLENVLLEDGCPLDDIDRLITELEYWRTQKVEDSAIELMRILGQAVLPPDENSAVDELEVVKETPKPRFPTGVVRLDRMTHGGGYGLTTVAGDAKAGKTMMAMGVAVEACFDGWRVVYINAELDRNEAIVAVMRKCGGTVQRVVNEGMTLVTPDFTFQPSDAIARVREAVQLGDERVLIVLDSINALVDLSSEGHGGRPALDYWAASAVWRNFAVRATKNSLGRLAFLVVSETNRQGQVKGGSLEFKSNLVIRIQKDPNDSESVTIDVTHSRSTLSGPIGKYLRDWKNGLFTSCRDEDGGGPW